MQVLGNVPFVSENNSNYMTRLNTLADNHEKLKMMIEDSNKKYDILVSSLVKLHGTDFILLSDDSEGCAKPFDSLEAEQNEENITIEEVKDN